MRITSQGQNCYNNGDFFFSYDPQERIEREEEEQLEKANRLSTSEWSLMNCEKF